MDMQTALQTDYIGSQYSLLELYLYKDDSGADFYVDAVHIGKNPTTNNANGTQPDTRFGFGKSLNDIRLYSCFSAFADV